MKLPLFQGRWVGVKILWVAPSGVRRNGWCDDMLILVCPEVPTVVWTSIVVTATRLKGFRETIRLPPLRLLGSAGPQR